MTPEKNDAALLLRLPSELKAALQRQAFANGRKISAEINMRLSASLKGGIGPHLVTPSDSAEIALLAAFRQLPPEKQSAVLVLLSVD